MFGQVMSAALLGIDGVVVSVEADAGNGLPSFDMVGYLGAEVREARERVRTALKNTGFVLAPGRLTVSLSPADLKKQGNYFDLPIAVAIMIAEGMLPQEYVNDCMFIGELGLDGSLRPITGALALAACAKEAGVKWLILPEENAREASCIQGVPICPAKDLEEVLRLLQEDTRKPYVREEGVGKRQESELDFSDVQGQEAVKRAAKIACAGMHNLLLIGPPGSGKTMIAKRIPGILPEMSLEEQIEISKIYSICGMLPQSGELIASRPFRSPHHTITPAALTGGGTFPRPGEISLASGGVLFLDELAEFQRETLEILRQPLEDKKVVINRIHGNYVFPAKCTIVANMNPCPCGYYPDRQLCKCSPKMVSRYLGRISRPLLDRIDICVEAPKVSFQELTQKKPAETSLQIRKQVEKAQEIQKERYQNTKIHFNSELSGALLDQYCALKPAQTDFLQGIFERLNLSARAYDRIRKVARTIADLSDSDEIRMEHLAEAVSYRSVDQKYWGGGM